MPCFGWSESYQKAILLLIYVLSPIDLLPELVLGPIGFVDDAFAIFFLVYYLFVFFAEQIADSKQGLPRNANTSLNNFSATINQLNSNINQRRFASAEQEGASPPDVSTVHYGKKD